MTLFGNPAPYRCPPCQDQRCSFDPKWCVGFVYTYDPTTKHPCPCRPCKGAAA